MGRSMPTECKHGTVIDWGGFGAEDGSSPTTCSECDAEQVRRFSETFTVQEIEALRDTITDLYDEACHALNEWEIDGSDRLSDAVLRARPVVQTCAWPMGDPRSRGARKADLYNEHEAMHIKEVCVWVDYPDGRIEMSWFPSVPQLGDSIVWGDSVRFVVDVTWDRDVRQPGWYPTVQIGDLPSPDTGVTRLRRGSPG